MRRIRIFPLVLATLVALTLTSCSEREAPLQPSPPDAPSALLGGLTSTLTGTTSDLLDLVYDLPPEPLSTPLRGLTQGVLSCPSSTTYTVTQWVGPDGGTIKVGPHTLVIPSRALSTWVQIRATAPAGSVTTVRFEPHGLRFDKFAGLTMSYAHCSGLTSMLKRVAYVDSNLRILEVLPSANDLINKRVTGKLDHFSSYAVAE